MLATLDLMTLAAARADVGCHTALSIFFRLQVVEFDVRFLFLVLHIVLVFLSLVC